MSKNIGYIKDGFRGKMNETWVKIGLQPDSHEGLGHWLGLPNGGDHGIYALLSLSLIIAIVAHYYLGVADYSVYIFFMWAAFLGNALFWVALEMWQAHRGNKQGWETNPWYNVFGWNRSRHQDWIVPTIFVGFLVLGFHNNYKHYYHDAFVVPEIPLTDELPDEGLDQPVKQEVRKIEKVGNYNLNQSQKNIKVCDVYQDDKDYQNCLMLMLPTLGEQSQTEQSPTEQNVGD